MHARRIITFFISQYATEMQYENRMLYRILIASKDSYR